jgi:ElaB/YqjD/DUF883 family membrane-anchored ribosome-binding protein
MSEYQVGDGAGGEPSLTEQAQEKVQQTARQASNKTAEYVRTQTEARASQAGEELRAVADALRRSGHALHADGKEMSGSAVDTVTQRMEQLSRYLGGTSGDQMLRDLESFGRGRPWGMIGLGLGVGIAASRFLKASSRSRYEATRATPSALPPSYGAVPYAEPVTQVGAAASRAD